jgi:hypothetical protein
MDRESLPPLNEIGIVVKDVLRGVRYLLRHSAGPRSLPGGVLVTRLDDTFAQFRHARELPGERLAAAFELAARLATAPRRESFPDDFRRAFHPLAKRVLALRGLDNVLIGEHVFAAAARSPLFDRRCGDAATPCAAAAVAIAAARPIELVDVVEVAAEDPFVRSPNSAVACAVGLAATAWISKSGRIDAAECLESAVEMTVPLHPRFARALAGTKPVDAVARLYGEYAAFIP